MKNFFNFPHFRTIFAFFALFSCFVFGFWFKNSFGLNSYRQINYILHRKHFLAFQIVSRVGEWLEKLRIEQGQNLAELCNIKLKT